MNKDQLPIENNSRHPRVLVFGGLNMGLITKVTRMPEEGETIRGNEFYASSGGKGATQAVAASRNIAEVKMIGKVGDDIFGKSLLDTLNNENIDTDHIGVDSIASTGTGVIIVDSSSQNRVIATYGANLKCDYEQLQSVNQSVEWADILMLQMEIPFELSVQAARIAKANNTTVLLDPAPASRIQLNEYQYFDVITPNQIEAEYFTGVKVEDENSAAKAAAILFDRGIGTVIITVGDQGVYYKTEDESGFVPAFKIDSIDTTSAGDAFNGAFASCLTKNMSIYDAVRFGCAAGALAVSKKGVQDSMPYSNDIYSFIENYCR